MPNVAVSLFVYASDTHASLLQTSLTVYFSAVLQQVLQSVESQRNVSVQQADIGISQRQGNPSPIARQAVQPTCLQQTWPCLPVSPAAAQLGSSHEGH